MRIPRQVIFRYLRSYNVRRLNGVPLSAHAVLFLVNRRAELPAVEMTSNHTRSRRPGWYQPAQAEQHRSPTTACVSVEQQRVHDTNASPLHFSVSQSLFLPY